MNDAGTTPGDPIQYSGFLNRVSHAMNLIYQKRLVVPVRSTRVKVFENLKRSGLLGLQAVANKSAKAVSSYRTLNSK